MSLARATIARVDWEQVQVLRGTGWDLANALQDFLCADSAERASELWWGLEGAAFAQNTIYGGAEPTVEAMVAAMADRPPTYLRHWIIEVLRFILSGDSEDDPALLGRCRERAQRGAWLLASEIGGSGQSDYIEAIMQVLELVDQEVAAAVQADRR